MKICIRSGIFDLITTIKFCGNHNYCIKHIFRVAYVIYNVSTVSPSYLSHGRAEIYSNTKWRS